MEVKRMSDKFIWNIKTEFTFGQNENGVTFHIIEDVDKGSSECLTKDDPQFIIVDSELKLPFYIGRCNNTTHAQRNDPLLWAQNETGNKNLEIYFLV